MYTKMVYQKPSDKGERQIISGSLVRRPFNKEAQSTEVEDPLAEFKGRSLFMQKLAQQAATRKEERYAELQKKNEELEEQLIDVSPRAEAEDQIFVKGNIPEYPKEITQSVITEIITEEAKLRNITPASAISLYKAEGFNSYQSTITKGSQKKIGGREASYGPFQLYVGGGLGNDYEEQTGRELAFDNTLEGIRKQVQFALDKAAEVGSWKAWSGRKSAGLEDDEGLGNAKPIYNWKEG